VRGSILLIGGSVQGDINGVVYRVNDRDEIVLVDDAWDRFAGANAGHRVLAREVLHHSLWDFVVDATTRKIYRQVLQRVRDGRSVAFRFRCDSPDRRRLLEMRIARCEDATIEFSTSTIEEEARPHLAVLDTGIVHSKELVKACGWCGRINVGHSWIEIEEALGHLRLFEGPVPPMLSHGVCEKCYGNMAAALVESPV